MAAYATRARARRHRCGSRPRRSPRWRAGRSLWDRGRCFSRSLALARSLWDRCFSHSLALALPCRDVPRPVSHTAPLRMPASRAGVARALGITTLCLVGLAATWVVAALVPVTHARDATALYDFPRLGRPRVDQLPNHILSLLEPSLYTVWALIVVGAALVRRRLRLALALALVLPLAPLSAEVLKPLLAHPHAYAGLKDINPASWPSGHATAAMTLALCAV